MKSIKRWGPRIFLILGISCSGASLASSIPRCDRESSKPNLDACAYEDLVAAEREMESIYWSIFEKYAKDATFLNKLESAQKSWIAFREADWQAQFACSEFNIRLCWGDRAYIDANIRRTVQTKERIRSLQNLLTNGPGR